MCCDFANKDKNEEEEYDLEGEINKLLEYEKDQQYRKKNGIEFSLQESTNDPYGQLESSIVMFESHSKKHYN